jgi:hypothetical protein
LTFVFFCNANSINWPQEYFLHDACRGTEGCRRGWTTRRNCVDTPQVVRLVGRLVWPFYLTISPCVWIGPKA